MEITNNLTKRTKSIKVYLFENEKATIEEKAAATGVTASEYLRSCGLKRVLATKPSADLVTIRSAAGMAKSELMMLLHLVKETDHPQLAQPVEKAIAFVDKTIAAAYNLNFDKDNSY